MFYLSINLKIIELSEKIFSIFLPYFDGLLIASQSYFFLNRLCSSIPYLYLRSSPRGAPGGSPTFVYFPFGIPHVQTQNCKHLKEESQEAFQLSSGSLSLLIEFAHCAVHSSRSNTLVCIRES